MLSCEEGDFLSEELSSLEGISPRLQQEANTSSPGFPEAEEHVKPVAFVAKKTNRVGFLGLAVTRTHPAQNHNKNIMSSKYREKKGTSWTFVPNEGSWESHLPCLSSLKLAP